MIYFVAQNTVQVFNTDSKSKIASLQINFEVIFWDWIDDKTLLMISENSVYRWNYENLDSVPIKWFDKSSSLDDCQIINAETDDSGHWCFVSGISLKVMNYLFRILFIYILNYIILERKNRREHSALQR